MTEYEALGRRLFEAYETGSPIDPLSDDHDLSIEDAYRVQAAVIENRLDDDRSAVGYKLGFTNEVIQAQYGVGKPAYGVLLDNTVITGDSVRTDQLIEPRIEPEIAFVLESSLSGMVTPYEVFAATRAIIPVIEVVDCRMEGTIDAADAVADNALAVRLVPGETTTDPRAIDVSMESVQVRKNARLVEAGTGAQVLGHPATAVSWLAEILSGQGASVPAGQVVSTGSLTTAIPVEPGDVIEARFGNLGTVSVAFE